MTYKIGFWGYPEPDITENLKRKYSDIEWIDLDIDFGHNNQNILPESYCKIITNIINNSIAIKPDMIVAPVGKDKCDGGWFAAKLLEDMGFNVLESKYEHFNNKKPINICSSNISLFDKVQAITANIIENKMYNLPQCEAQFGFWGVPPNDLNILKLFPNNTHVYGWLRCVEAGTPADIDLEMQVDIDVPTVFYSQAFCAKSQLAKYLADKYNGLYIDIDDYANNSTKAKIEAFLRLR